MGYLFPRLEKVAVDSTISHFLLMLGYKMFSVFLPIFLFERGLSLSKVGYVYLLIYLPIAFFSPIVGALVHRHNPALLSSLGIAGYAIYSLGLLFFPTGSIYYLLQIILGASAALFFVSTRVVIMRSKIANFDSAFGAFYSAPLLADILGPALGAAAIYFFGFPGVFVASLAIYSINIIFNFHIVADHPVEPLSKIGTKEIFAKYLHIFSDIKNSRLLPFIILSFTILFVEGFYHAFFILFLSHLGFSRESILIYFPVMSAILIPLSYLGIKYMGRRFSAKNLLTGGLISGLASMFIGSLGGLFNLTSIFGLNIAKSLGSFIANSGRSGMLSRNFAHDAEEAGALDTIFSPLGVGLGSLAGGLIVGSFGFQTLFLVGGGLIIVASLVAFIFLLRHKGI